jgi:hypothetical protein
LNNETWKWIEFEHLRARFNYSADDLDSTKLEFLVAASPNNKESSDNMIEEVFTKLATQISQSTFPNGEKHEQNLINLKEKYDMLSLILRYQSKQNMVRYMKLLKNLKLLQKMKMFEEIIRLSSCVVQIYRIKLIQLESNKWGQQVSNFYLMDLDQKEKFSCFQVENSDTVPKNLLDIETEVKTIFQYLNPMFSHVNENMDCDQSKAKILNEKFEEQVRRFFIQMETLTQEENHHDSFIIFINEFKSNIFENYLEYRSIFQT